MTTEAKVFDYLDRLKSDNCEVPSMRSIHAAVGGGSMTTIWKAVRKWKNMNSDDTDENVPSLPDSFPEDLSRQMHDSIWKAFLPMLQEKLDAQQRIFDKELADAREDLISTRASEANLKVLCEEQRKQIKKLEAALRNSQLETAQAKGALKALKSLGK